MQKTETHTINAPFCETYTAAASALLNLCYTIYHKDWDAGLLSGRSDKAECIDYYADCKTGDDSPGKVDRNKRIFSVGSYRDISVVVTCGDTASSSRVRITTDNSEVFDRVWQLIDRHISGERSGGTCRTALPKPKPVPESPAEPAVVLQPAPAPMPEPLAERKSEKRSEKHVEKERIEILILFESDDWSISPKYLPEIKKAADMLKSNPEATAEIQGHTDSLGSEMYNLKLSQRRSEGVKRALIEKFGIDASRLTTKNYGKSNPVGDNNNGQGRQENRRAIILFFTDKR